MILHKTYVAEPKITLIIPYYESGTEGIQDSVFRVLKQSYHNFEVILVYNCPPDSTHNIKNTISISDPRVVLLCHQDIQGQGDMRNMGLQAASGDYLLFLNSQYHLKDNYIQSLVANIVDQQVEIIIPQLELIKYTGANNNVNSLSYQDGEKEFRVMSGIESYKSVLGYPGKSYIPSYCWGSLFNKKLFTDFGIEFNFKEFGDLDVIPFIYKQAKKISYIPEVLISYDEAKENDLNKNKWDTIKLNRYKCLWNLFQENIIKHKLEKQLSNSALAIIIKLLEFINQDGIKMDSYVDFNNLVNHIGSSIDHRSSHSQLFLNMIDGMRDIKMNDKIMGLACPLSSNKFQAEAFYALYKNTEYQSKKNRKLICEISDLKQRIDDTVHENSTLEKNIREAHYLLELSINQQFLERGSEKLAADKKSHKFKLLGEGKQFNLDGLRNLGQGYASYRQELEEIKRSKAWKTALYLRRIREFILPYDSTRERFIRLMYRFITSPKHYMLSNYSLIKGLKLVKESGFFDETWYLKNNPDLAQTKLDPLKHFLLHGGFEGRDPGPNFSSNWYLEEYTDVKTAGINPLLHFLTHGQDEGRFPISPTEFKKNRDQDNMPTESKTSYNAIGNEQDLNRSNSNDQDLSLGNKVPAQMLEHETSVTYTEIITTQNPEKASTLEDVRLFAVIGTWMEEDVIGATVQNAFTQGCEKVYLVDNDSSDNTVKVACENGAILAKSFASNQYNEEERLFYMNSVMREVSEQEGEPHLWWLLLDADEFPHGPSGMTILKYIRTLDRQFRVIGSRFFDHYPNAEPAYTKGRHPIDFQPLCEEISLPMCHSNHRKHQLLRYDKDSLNIEAGPGFHLVRCSEPLFEPIKTILCHHFPFREKEITYQKLSHVWEKNESGVSRANPASDTHMLARMLSIEAVYNQDWESVVNYVSLDPINDSLENKAEETGVHLKPWAELVPLEDQQVLRWYPMLNSWNYESLPEFNYGDDVSYVEGMVFLDGHGDIEDWGCGFGHAKQFVKQSKYIGIDGSSPSADKRVDLSSYTSNADCIFIRHVLEHNTNWAKILKNAVSSFRKRMVLIIFTPFSETTRILRSSDILTNFPVPDISFSRLDLMAFFEDLNVNEESITSDTQYGVEHIFYLEKM